uniref:Uncharacterized protein n=1 Tax=Romanomermis culicivorax TaxID=13658 RepID=A0A915I772_ROMCU
MIGMREILKSNFGVKDSLDDRSTITKRLLYDKFISTNIEKLLTSLKSSRSMNRTLSKGTSCVANFVASVGKSGTTTIFKTVVSLFVPYFIVIETEMDKKKMDNADPRFEEIDAPIVPTIAVDDQPSVVENAGFINLTRKASHVHRITGYPKLSWTTGAKL